MPYDLDALFGSVVARKTLCSDKARAVARYASASDVCYVRLVECRRSENGDETAILDLDIEVAQRPVHDIRSVERMAVKFFAADTHYPEVVSLREDFPPVPHLNQRPIGYPKSLCLYGESYSEVKLHWTAHRFVERIRFWLAKTADGNLHPDDQPLEPLVTSSHGTLVVPEELLIDNNLPLQPRYVSAVDPMQRDSVWMVHNLDSGVNTAKPPGHIATSFTCPVQTHGVMSAAPSNLDELQQFLVRAGFDFLPQLQKRIEAWRKQKEFASVGEAQLFLIFNLPKSRTDAGPVESTDHVAFLCGCKVEDLEKRLENFAVAHTHQGIIQIPSSVLETANIPLLPFYVTLQFSPAVAAKLNDVPSETRNFCLLGAGAIGSQLLDTTLRSGFGKWTVMDDDRLMPHNLARHQLTGSFLGRRKADSVSYLANDLLREKVAAPIAANVLRPGKEEVAVRNALHKASAICDCTASVPVARALATDAACHRVISFFLNPTANALVMLVEDERRHCRLDWLEMQYYRAVAHHIDLADHLRTASQLRYSNACRSLTSRVSAEAVSLFAAIGSRAFRECVGLPDGRICVWRLQKGMEITRIEVPVEPIIVQEISTWTVCIDNALLHALHRFRGFRLPNETGGVLLGSYDMQRKLLYIVDMLPSPPDSEEWPASYKRGCTGLGQAVCEIQDRTLTNLEYVGEWHSHPDGCGTEMSKVDKVAMKEIAEEMSKTGLPGLILIVGADGSYSLHLRDADQVS
jgi:hypothetical protein